MATGVGAGDEWRERPRTTTKAVVSPTMLRAEGPASRWCGPVDLRGTWELLAYSSTQASRRPNAPYRYPYQLFEFAEDGAMRSAHSLTDFGEPPAAVLARIPKSLAYDVSPSRQGLLAVKAQGDRTVAERWQCRVLTIDQVDLPHRRILRRGDVVLTLLGKTGSPLFTRHLRKS